MVKWASLLSVCAAFVTHQRREDVIGLRSTFAAEDGDLLPRGSATFSTSVRVYLPISTYRIKLMRVCVRASVYVFPALF